MQLRPGSQLECGGVEESRRFVPLRTAAQSARRLRPKLALKKSLYDIFQQRQLFSVCPLRALQEVVSGESWEGEAAQRGKHVVVLLTSCCPARSESPRGAGLCAELRDGGSRSGCGGERGILLLYGKLCLNEGEKLMS